MSFVRIDELRRGERVVLFCPTSQRARRVAVFEGRVTGDELLDTAPTDQLPRCFKVRRDAEYAEFIFESDPGTRTKLIGAMEIEGDHMKDDMGRAIYIEARASVYFG